MPARYAQLGDLHAGIDEAPCALDAILELSRRQEAEGQGDAPWPPHYAKQEGEPPRVQPSKAKKPSSKKTTTTGRREPKFPLMEIAKAATKEEALAGLDRWKARHPAAAALLAEDDVLVDQMRGRSSAWYRIRLNLRHIPEADRPAPEPPDPDFDPWAA